MVHDLPLGQMCMDSGDKALREVFLHIAADFRVVILI